MANLFSMARETSPGIFHCTDWGVELEASVIDSLVEVARVQPSRKARLCMHPNIRETEQQMLLVMVKGAEDDIHMHPHKREALIPVAGSARYETFDEFGGLLSSRDFGGGGLQYISSPVGVYHRVVLHQELLVFWEMALGPFSQDSTRKAPWVIGE